MLPVPPSVPFVEYVLRAMEHPPCMFVSKLAACCTMLFITRTDPDLLRSLCHKWAVRFTMDRLQLITRIRRRSQLSASNLFLFRSASTSGMSDFTSELNLCDPDACVDHFLKILHSLVPFYFSWNWQRMDYVIQMNWECNAYVREHLLPICIMTSAEEGEDEELSDTWRLLPKGYEFSTLATTYLRPACPTERQCFASAALSLSDAPKMLTLNGHNVGGARPMNGECDTMENATDTLDHMFSSTGTQTRQFFVLESQDRYRHQRSCSGSVHTGLRDVPGTSVNSISSYQSCHSGLIFATFANFGNILCRNVSGLVIVFHAKYSPKSNEALAAFSKILLEKFVDPSPVIAVVYSVAEPELAQLYNISWFPTIVYVPAPSPGSPALLVDGNRVCVMSTSSNSTSLEMLSFDSNQVMVNVDGDALSPHTPMEDYALGLAHSINNDGHVVYPIDGATSVEALAEWLVSKGEAPPRVSDNDYPVPRVHKMRGEQKFQQIREHHSAVVMLRRLQGKSTVKTTTTSSQSKQLGTEAPLFVFLGGGMAAGKSTAAAALANSDWWKELKDQSVLVNADEFKMGETPFSASTADDSHILSTRTAESLLVQALNQGRSTVLDSTMMWAPFVRQVIEMVRSAHTTLYKQGPGFIKEGGAEEYFTPLKPRSSPLPTPYHIHFLAITVEPSTAVPRGILRKFSTGRGVPISTQLRSFRLFADNFPMYAFMVDSVTLYNNNVTVDLEKGELPPVLAERDAFKTGGVLRIYDREAYRLFLKQSTLNENADNIQNLYLSHDDTMDTSKTVKSLADGQ